MNTEEKEQLQEQINKLQNKLDELNSKPELEIGKWYKFGDCLMVWNDGEITYGFFTDCWGVDWSFSVGEAKYATPATNKEVEDALIAEAKRRGFKKGVTFKCAVGGGEIKFSKNIYYLSSTQGNVLWNGGIGRIFSDGKWAEIIKEPKVTINGYDMNVDGDEVSFGCAKFNKHQITSLMRHINSFDNWSSSNRKIASIKLDSEVEITVEQLKEICNELNKKKHR